MRALRFVEYQQQPELVEVETPRAGPGQVVIKVAGSGACHSDLHVLEWPSETSPIAPPFTLGHENAGWVEEVGAGVTELAPGDAVAVYGPWGCGVCRRCRSGMENYCERPFQGAYGGGLGLDGGMAEYRSFRRRASS